MRAPRASPLGGIYIRAAKALIKGTSNLSATLTVERGVNEARMGGFTLIFATGLGVGLSVGLACSSAFLGVLAASAPQH